MVEGGPVTEAALSDRRPLPRARRRCLWAALPDPLARTRTPANDAGVPRSYLSQSEKL